jgi:hypothetical protein
MHVKVLDYVVYSENGCSWETHKVVHPTWQQIDGAIRKLDRFRYPFLFLWPTEDESKHIIDGSADVLEVMGGEGAYWLAGSSANGLFQRRLNYPDRGNKEVVVWTSDQGFADAERHVCRDVEAVVQAAKHYCEHAGELDPSLPWE